MIKLLIIFIFSTVFRTLFICYSLKSQQYVSFNIFRTFYFDKLLLFSLFIIPFLIWIFKNISLNFYELNTSYNIEPKKFIIILIVIMIFLFSILIFPFNKHQKPILIIDEIHSKWESTLIEYNMKITGTFAENSYYSFLNYLSHFYEIKILTNKKKHYKIPKNCFIKYTNSITSKTLEQYPKSILILKCSTKQYSKKEVNIIDNYMKKGNGVFLIGDHTNVMFMNSFLNEISEKYGIKYNYDSVYMTNGGWITLGKNELLNNPINLNISEFIWATNCSLSISKKAKTIMYSPLCCFSDKADYTNNYFFGSRKIESSEIFGRFPIVATVKVGKGKLAAFTDSTCFNNYLMFTASRREFINGIINYLSTEYGFNYNLIISILCVIILFFILKRSGFSNILFYLYLIIPLIIPFCFSFSNYINKLNYKIYKPIKKLPKTIGFDAVHKPVHCFSHGNSEDFLSSGSYDSLIFDIPRKDFFVDIFYKGKLTYNKLKKYYCYIISKPTVKYSNKEIYELKKYINNGGHILIFTGRSNYKNYEDQILNCFGFNIIDKKIIFSSNSALMNPIEIEGGENIYSLISNNTYNIVNYKKISKGSVLVISDDYLFTKISINYYSRQFKKLINKILISLNSIKKLKKINWNYYLTTDLKDISYYLKKMAEDKNKNSTKFNLN